MTRVEALDALEDVLDVEKGSLSEDTQLNGLDAYDSMAKLSIIVFADDDFGKKLTGEQIRDFKTIGHILDFLLA